MRAALYFTPPADDPLTRAAALWLGRDAFTGAATRPADPAIDPLVAEPARYGFHATLRAPFRPAEGVTVADLEACLERLASAASPVAIPRLVLDRLGRFFALVPATTTPPALLDLEGSVLDAFEPYRAPLDAAEVARRDPERLSPRQRDHMARWGYPFVREDFRFHMTLTGPVANDRADAVEDVLRNRFAAFDGPSLPIRGLALFIEPEPGAPFLVRCLAGFAA